MNAASRENFMTEENWRYFAACIDRTEKLFPDSNDHVAITAAKIICNSCVVKDQCLEYAVTDKPIIGVWGGKTTNELTREINKRNLVARGQA